MNEPDWAKVLAYLYEENQTPHFRSIEGFNENSDIVKRTGLEPKDLSETLEYLRQINLVERWTEKVEVEEPKTQDYFSLTDRGFDVAHDRELTNAQHETSKRNTRLSAYLVLAVITQALAAITNTEAWTNLLLMLMILGIAILVFVETR